MVRTLPLRIGYFPTPKLNETEENELLSWARTLLSCFDANSCPWRYLHARKNVQIAEDRQKGGVFYSIRGITTIEASLDDIMDIFITTTTSEYRNSMKLLLGDMLLDAATLYQREQNDLENLSIKWLALKSQSALSSNIDFCVLEYAALITNEMIQQYNLQSTLGASSQLPIGVCIYESIEQAECPSLQDSHKLERGSISRCGYLFRPINETTIEAQFVCSIRQPTNPPTTRRSNRGILQLWAESLSTIQDNINQRKISRLFSERSFQGGAHPFQKVQWVEDKDRQCCQICVRSFTSIRRKHHCRACGEVICSKCSNFANIDLPTTGRTNVRLCKTCFNGKSLQMANIFNTSAPFDMISLNDALSDSSSSQSGNGGGAGANSEQYALTIQDKVKSVPDIAGIKWLQQIAARDPDTKQLVENLVEHLKKKAAASSTHNRAIGGAITGPDDVVNGNIGTRSQRGNSFTGYNANLYETTVNDTTAGDQDSPPEDIYDLLCDLASEALNCKFAVVSFTDENRQWFKSKINIRETDIPRDFSFCELPVREKRPIAIMNCLKDPRFQTNPFVTGVLQVRFLAGAPLYTIENEIVGSVCVLDTEPRVHLQHEQVLLMEKLAHLAMVSMQERRGISASAGMDTLKKKANPFAVLETPPIPFMTQRKSDLVPLSDYSFTTTTLSRFTSSSSFADASGLPPSIPSIGRQQSDGINQQANKRPSQIIRNQMMELLHQSTLTQQQLEETQRSLNRTKPTTKYERL